MFRPAILLILATTAVAAADPLPVDVVTKGQVGDWTIFEGSGPAYKGRWIIRLGCPVQEKTAHVVWFRGFDGAERHDFAYVADAEKPIDSAMFGEPSPKNFKTEPARCKLDAEFDCTKISFTRIDGARVEVKMAPRVRGSGIVELKLEIKDRGTSTLRAVGYGRHALREWGVAAPTAALVDPTYKPGDPSYKPDLRGVTTVMPGPQPAGKSGPKLVCPVPKKIDFGTIGNGSGTGSPPPPGGMRARRAGVPVVRLGNAVVSPDQLDKAIVRRYLKRNLQRFLYCYEKQLLVNENLQGTMHTKYTIEPDGKVTGVSARGVDPDVSTCVGNALGAIEYPKPKGGQAVNVTMDFTFRPTGE
jgi:hypothetical protein